MIVNFCLSKHLYPSEERLTDQRGSLAYVSPDILSGEYCCVRFVGYNFHIPLLYYYNSESGKFDDLTDMTLWYVLCMTCQVGLSYHSK